MPNIVASENMTVHRQGDGWVELTLANAETFGAPAMIARRWSFKPGARGPKRTHGDVEQMLYVIRGSGVAHVGGRQLQLKRETMLWLESGDEYQIEAGAGGLEILQGYAAEE